MRPDSPILRFLFAGTVAGLVGMGAAVAQPKAAGPRFHFVDLQPQANHTLADRFGRIEGNNLASLPTGEQTFAEVKFDVADRILFLDSPRLLEHKANKIEGVAIGRLAHKLRFLHGTVFGNSNPAISDDKPIAEYTVHYDDGSSATEPILYGRDVRDWSSPEECRLARRGKIAWVGDNDESVRLERHLCVYLGTWINPKPEKQIAKIDFGRVGDSPAAPFCVAITAEE
jgi:hypothetical protein